MKTIYEVAYDIVNFINETEQPNNQLTSWELCKAVNDCVHDIEMFISDNNFNHIKQYTDRLCEEINNGNNDACNVIVELGAYIASEVIK